MLSTKIFVRGLFVLFLLAGLLAGALAPMMASVKAAPQQAPVNHVVISEFRTRGPNGGNDEFIELFNPTSVPVDISNWQLKRSSGCGATIYSIATIPASTNLGAGKHFLIAGSTYNGSTIPDLTTSLSISDSGGIALLDSTSTIIDQVGMCTTTTYKEPPDGSGVLTPLSVDADQSYERQLDVTGGCVDTDINSADFFLRKPSDPQDMASPITTCGNPTSTPAPPTSTPTSAPLHSLIINEVAWMGTSSANPNDEWIELYNPGTTDINLNGWRLVTDDGNNFDITLSGTIPGGSGSHYFIIGRYLDIFTDVTVNLPYTTSMGIWRALSNSGTTLRLLSPTGSTVDTANSAGGMWTSGSMYPNYASMERFLFSSSSNDIPSDWKTFGGTPFAHDRNGNPVYGSPGRVNWAELAKGTPTATPTLTRTPTKTGTPTVTGTPPTLTPTIRPTATRRPTSIPPTPFAHVIINEFLPRAGFDWNNDGVIDTNDEFIEIENLGPIKVDLSGWQLDDIPNGGSAPYTLSSKILNPGDRAVFYGSTTHIVLDDSGDTVRLIRPSGTVMDAHSYSVAKYPDQSWCRFPDGGEQWNEHCFPTPGNENTLTGVVSSPPPPKLNQSPACLLPDTTPQEFILAECNAFGENIWNQSYWNHAAGQNEFIIPDLFSKGQIIIE